MDGKLQLNNELVLEQTNKRHFKTFLANVGDMIKDSEETLNPNANMRESERETEDVYFEERLNHFPNVREFMSDRSRELLLIGKAVRYLDAYEQCFGMPDFFDFTRFNYMDDVAEGMSGICCKTDRYPTYQIAYDPPCGHNPTPSFTCCHTLKYYKEMIEGIVVKKSVADQLAFNCVQGDLYHSNLLY